MYDTTFNAHPDEALAFDTHREYIIQATDTNAAADDTTNGDATTGD